MKYKRVTKQKGHKRVTKQNSVGSSLLICSRKSFRKPILPLLCSNFDAGDMYSQARQARARLLVTGVNHDLPTNTAFTYCHNKDQVSTLNGFQEILRSVKNHKLCFKVFECKFIVFSTQDEKKLKNKG